MSKIKILPPNIVQKIAAGEVVERPASVLKELIENAIDADSASIKIILEKGGVEKIQVVDNGEGISRKELPFAFERHSTSKISSEDDLISIRSLGFRGEALYSIAAVSRVKVESKQKGKGGAVFEINGGKGGEIKTIGCPEGTNVVVADLFFNIPARKKFLKSESTELKYCRSVFIAQALAHPDLRFELWHGGKKLFQLSKQDLKQRVIEIYELPEDDLLPVIFDHPYLKITGFIGKPGTARSRKVKQHLFINQRSVENRLVWLAVKQGYGSYLPLGSYPLFFLNFNIRPDLIDVNIHPRKEEVKFAVSDFIFDGVKQAVTKALGKYDLTPAAGVEKISDQIKTSEKEKSLRRPWQVRTISPIQSKQAFTFNREVNFPDSIIGTGLGPVSTETAKTERLPWEKEVSVPASIFQINLTYLFEVKNNEIVIYDQHALSERILFEKFINQYLSKQKQAETQSLLFPEEIRLSEEERKIVEKEMINLEKVGFQLELTETGISILAIPVIMKSDELQRRFVDFVDGLISQEELLMEGDWKIDKRTLRMLSFLACRTAIKAGEYLNETETRELLNQFRQTRERYTCPHGRPVVVRMGRKELDKMFLR